MSDVRDKRDKKNELLFRKETLKNLIREHIRNNINKIKRIIYNYTELSIQVLPNWMELVAMSRLASWISQLRAISKIQILKENLYNEDYSIKIRNTEDIYRALTVYTLLRDKITTDRKKLEGTFVMECHINLINGDILYHEIDLKTNYKSPLEIRTYENINNLLKTPFILKVGEFDYKLELFNIKMEEVIGLFLDLEKLDEDEINNILTQRYLNSKVIPPFVKNNELSNPKLLNLMDDFVLKYTRSLFSKKYSVEKKAIITNLLVLGLPGLIGRLDISYFQDKEEFYLVYWISNPLINS